MSIHSKINISTTESKNETKTKQTRLKVTGCIDLGLSYKACKLCRKKLKKTTSLVQQEVVIIVERN